jgi:GrpB-like predicted nucleotidyltransferase (UPF0157 family)
MSDGGIHTVTLVPYDPAWPTEFAALRSVWATALGDLALAVANVGSTSIPGMPAKAILDVDIVVSSLDRLPEVIARLAPLGYNHVGERGVSGREAFKRQDDTVPRDGSGRAWMRHHLYVCPEDGRELRRHLAFRDHLRTHPEVAAEYAALKTTLAARFATDVDAYCEAKTGFVEAVLQVALKSRPSRVETHV